MQKSAGMLYLVEFPAARPQEGKQDCILEILSLPIPKLQHFQLSGFFSLSFASFSGHQSSLCFSFWKILAHTQISRGLLYDSGSQISALSLATHPITGPLIICLRCCTSSSDLVLCPQTELICILPALQNKQEQSNKDTAIIPLYK